MMGLRPYVLQRPFQRPWACYVLTSLPYIIGRDAGTLIKLDAGIHFFAAVEFNPEVHS